MSKTRRDKGRWFAKSRKRGTKRVALAKNTERSQQGTSLGDSGDRTT